MSIALAATIVILVVLIATAANTAVHRYDNFLEGLWSGDPGYLETALLNDFQLYIGPREHGRRQGYLIQIDNTGTFVTNQAIEIKEPPMLARWLPALRNTFKSKKDAYVLQNVQFTYAEGAPMPAYMKLTLSIFDGTLILSDDEKIYAYLTKDIAASLAAIAVAAELE